MKSLSTLLLTLLFALTGCGDPVVDTDYRGDSLLTLQGQLRATPNYQPEGPLHVALVWFPKSMLESEDGAEVPDLYMTVAEDMVIEGTFPLDYRFDVFQPPPPEALGTWGEGLQGKGAMGFLVAYEDLNGNGKLDRIPLDGTPKDRVIGSSFYESPQYMVLYADTAQPGVNAGFNIARAGEDEGEPVFVPSSTELPLTLTAGGDAYDALVCEGGPLTYLFLPVCGLGGDDTGGGEQPPFSRLGLAGEMKLKDGHLEVFLQASYDGEHIPDAEVTLAGRTLPFDTAKQAFVVSEDASTLLTPGATVRLELSGRGESTFRDLQVPGDFTITAPGEGAEVTSGSQLTAQWTAAPGATQYRVDLVSPGRWVSTGVEEGALSHTLEVGTGTGSATLSVEAISSSNGGSFFEPIWVDVAFVKSQAFTLVP
jgi:hypothetical protein